MHVEFFEDPRPFLALAGPQLAAAPVVSSVIATVSERWALRFEAGEVEPPEHPLWWAVVRDADGGVAGLAMGTAPHWPHPPYLLPMADDAALALATAVREQLGLRPGGVNGALPAGQRVAAAWSGRADIEPALHHRLWEISEVTAQRPAPGQLRLAEPAEAERVHAWLVNFHVEAEEQAGRTVDARDNEGITVAEVRQRIGNRRLWWWQDEQGRPVHLTGATLPAYGVSRVGPVYTPVEHRGHGYASNAVEQVSRELLGAGERVCLFTDQANPVSNAIYAAIGYRPVMDTANFIFTPA